MKKLHTKTAKSVTVDSWLAGSLDGLPNVTIGDPNNMLFVDDDVKGNIDCSDEQIATIRWRVYELLGRSTMQKFGYYDSTRHEDRLLLEGDSIEVFCSANDQIKAYLAGGHHLFIDQLKQLVVKNGPLVGDTFLIKGRKVLYLGNIVCLKNQLSMVREVFKFDPDDPESFRPHFSKRNGITILVDNIEESNFPYHFDLAYCDSFGPHHADILKNLQMDTALWRPGHSKIIQANGGEFLFSSLQYRHNLSQLQFKERLAHFEEGDFVVRTLVLNETKSYYQPLFKIENDKRVCTLGDFDFSDVVIDLGKTKLSNVDWFGITHMLKVEIKNINGESHLALGGPLKYLYAKLACCTQSEFPIPDVFHPCNTCSHNRECKQCYSLNVRKIFHSLICLGYEPYTTEEYYQAEHQCSNMRTVGKRYLSGWSHPESYLRFPEPLEPVKIFPAVADKKDGKIYFIIEVDGIGWESECFENEIEAEKWARDLLKKHKEDWDCDLLKEHIVDLTWRDYIWCRNNFIKRLSDERPE